MPTRKPPGARRYSEGYYRDIEGYSILILGFGVLEL